MNNELKRIICIIEFIKWKNGVDPSVHPTMALLSELWPILEKCVSVAGKHEDIAESICRIFKRVIRSTTPLALNPMVPNLAHLLTSAFETTFQSSYLYCASVCITDFSEVQEAHSALLTMSAKMFHLFSTTAGSLEKYIEFPDVTDEMFYMMEKCLKHLPQLFSMPIVDAALKSCCTGFSLQHSKAHKSILSFSDKLFRGASNSTNAIVHQSIQSNLPLLLVSILRPMAQDQMRAKHIYGDSLSLLTLLQQLCQLPTLNATTLLPQALQQIPNLTPTQSSSFIQSWNQATNSSELRKAVQLLSTYRATST